MESGHKSTGRDLIEHFNNGIDCCSKLETNVRSLIMNNNIRTNVYQKGI